MAASTRDIGLLHRRLAFGARGDEIDAAAAKGFDATLHDLLDLSAIDAADRTPAPSLGPDELPPSEPAARKAFQQQRRADELALVGWWLSRMVTSTVPAREKLVLIWHGHFATAIDKVKSANLMYAQNELFRRAGAGRFVDLVQAVAKDLAMLIWLDSNSNVKAHPNENFARELLELFTRGLGNYTEDDVKEAARCFTGWSYDRTTQSFHFRPMQHDDGTKRVLGRSGNFGGEDVIGMAVGDDVSARFLASRLWSRLAFPVLPDDSIVTSLVAARTATVLDLVRAIVLRPAFLSDATRSGLVKQPIEWLVGALRALRVPYEPAFVAVLLGLGQVPFDPPSVAGWPQNIAWLSSAASLARLNGAALIASRAELDELTSLPPARRTAACARLLGVDAWSTASAAALEKAATDPRALVATALVAPEFVMN